MFDVKQDLAIKIPSPEGVKRAEVRYPTDAEWIEWRRKKRIQQKDLGRRSFQIEASKPEQADLELYQKIRNPNQESAPQIDEAEAYYIISELVGAEVAERPERDGQSFAIKLKAMRRFSTLHVLRVPTMKESMEYERMRSSVVFGQYGTQEIRVNFSAAAGLYDKLKQRVEGYVGEVPVPHKAEAVNVLLQEIRAEQDEESSDDDDLG